MLTSAALAGCATTQTPVVETKASACAILHTPDYAVKGKTAYDQAWINKTTEGLVNGCDQPRPQVRPAKFDTPPPVAAEKATTQEPTPEKQAAKRRKWFGL